MHHAFIRWSAAGALAATLLAGCGGGSDGPPVDDAPSRVPASATASPAAYTAYVAGLRADDRREPVGLEGLVPPTTETAEPAAVDR
jgi:hypothetical protein